jgi:hypothetical protein
MARERVAWFGLAALLVVGLVWGAVASSIAGGQRDAWLEGYTMGRLTAAAGVDGAVVPLAPYVGPGALSYGPGVGARGPGFGGPSFGGLLLFLVGAGALFFVVRRVLHARGGAWAAMQGSAAGIAPGAPPFGPHFGPGPGGRAGGPWPGHRRCGPWGAGWEQAQAAERAPGAESQGGQATPSPADPSSAPEQPSVQR